MPSLWTSHTVTSLVWGWTKDDLAVYIREERLKCRLVPAWETDREPLRDGRGARGEFR